MLVFDLAWLGEVARDQPPDLVLPRGVKDEVEERLFARRLDLFAGNELVFFDTISVYFTGEGERRWERGARATTGGRTAIRWCKEWLGIPSGAGLLGRGAPRLAIPEFGYRDGRRYDSVELGGDPLPGAVPEVSLLPLVEVFVLDSNTLGEQQRKLEDGTDEPQLRWLADALERSRAPWKVVVLHHPTVAPTRCRWLWFGCRGADAVLRTELEPILRAARPMSCSRPTSTSTPGWSRGLASAPSSSGGKKPDRLRPDSRTVDRPDRGAFSHFVIVEATRERFAFRVVDTEGRTRGQGAFGPDEPAESPRAHGPPLRADRRTGAHPETIASPSWPHGYHGPHARQST